MKKQYLRVRIAFVTLALGLASVNFFNWANNNWNEIQVDLPKAESASVLEITTKHKGTRFEIIGSACGGTNEYGGSSSIIGYQTNEWEALSKSSSCQSNAKESQQEIEAPIKDSTKVFVDSKSYDEQSKLQKRRVVLEKETNGKRRFNILIYNGENSIKIIEAKSLKLVLELEQALKTESN